MQRAGFAKCRRCPWLWQREPVPSQGRGRYRATRAIDMERHCTHNGGEWCGRRRCRRRVTAGGVVFQVHCCFLFPHVFSLYSTTFTHFPTAVIFFVALQNLVTTHGTRNHQTPSIAHRCCVTRVPARLSAPLKQHHHPTKLRYSLQLQFRASVQHDVRKTKATTTCHPYRV